MRRVRSGEEMNALAALDHLVYATPDLECTVDELAVRLGVRAVPGGQHPGRGTRNALIAVSPTSYLEIVGPDPAQATLARPRWFAVDSLTEPRLVAWAAKARDLEVLSEAAARAGVRLGPITVGSRSRSSGEVLSWTFTDPAVVIADGIVPFFIDWGTSAHPARSAPVGPSLTLLTAEHPEPEEVRVTLAALGLDLRVTKGAAPRLIAAFKTPGGDVQLS